MHCIPSNILCENAVNYWLHTGFHTTFVGKKKEWTNFRFYGIIN